LQIVNVSAAQNENHLKACLLLGFVNIANAQAAQTQSDSGDFAKEWSVNVLLSSLPFGMPPENSSPHK
jgi:hypothetical protein